MEHTQPDHTLDMSNVTGLSPETLALYKKYATPIDQVADEKAARQLLLSGGIMDGNPMQIGEYTVQAVSDGSMKPARIRISQGSESDEVAFPSWQALSEFVAKFNEKVRTLPKLIGEGVSMNTTRDGGNREKNRGSLREALIYAVNL